MPIPAEPQVYRLTDMQVQEVSLVDRPANKRKMLIIKRARVEKAAEPQATDGTAVGATGITIVPPGFKAVAGPMIAKITAKLTSISDAVSAATDGEIAEDGSLPPVPEAFIADLGGVSALLDRLVEMYTQGAPSGADQELPENGDVPEDTGEPAPQDMIMRAEQCLAKIGVLKIGAKMSKDRLTRLEQAANLILSLIGEMRTIPDTPALDGVAKADHLARLEAAVSSVGEALVKLSEVVQKQGADIASVKKARGESNAAHIDGGSSGSTGAKFSWAMDLNRPVKREF